MGIQRADSIECGQYLEVVKREFAENALDVEPTKGLISKEAVTAEATAQPPSHQKEEMSPTRP